MICAVPELGVEFPEQPARGWLPRPPKIKTQLPQWLQSRRQDRSDIVSLKSRHVFELTVAGGGDPGCEHDRFGDLPFEYPANRAAVNQEILIGQVAGHPPAGFWSWDN